MEFPIHTRDSTDGNQERSPSKERKDPPTHFFAETSPSPETGKGKDLSHTFKEFYQSKKKLQEISQQVHSELSSQIRPIHDLVQEGERLDLSDCVKAGALLPRLDLPTDTQEGRLIPREHHNIASIRKDAPSLSDEHRDRIAVIHSATFSHAYNLYTKNVASAELWKVGMMKAHQVAYVLTYAQLFEHAFQEQRSSFEPKMAQKIQQEFSKRRNKIEQHMGFPDILGLLKQGRQDGSTHEQKGFLSNAMHTQLNDEYHKIEALPYNRARLEALDGFAEKLFSAQRVFALTGKTADHTWYREMADHGRDGEKSAEQQLRQEISQRAEGMAKTEGWEKVRETITKVLTDQEIDKKVRICVAKAFGDLGKQLPSEMKKSIANDLVGRLDSNDIPAEVRSSMARALGEIGERSVVNDLVGRLDKNNIPEEVRSSMASALGEMGKKSSGEMKTSIAKDLVKQLDKDNLSEKMHSSIVHAIGEIGELSVASDFFDQFDKDDISDEMRSSIVKTLGEIGKKSSGEMKTSIVNGLVGRLDKNDISDEMRSSMAHALGEMGKQSPTETRRSIVNDLVGRLDKNDIPEGVRISIARTVREIGDSSVAKNLEDLLDNDNIRGSLRSSIIAALEEVENAHWFI